jgi:sialic acid synthase SpsE
MEIAGREIGQKQPPYIVIEIGGGHPYEYSVLLGQKAMISFKKGEPVGSGSK